MVVKETTFFRWKRAKSQTEHVSLDDGSKHQWCSQGQNPKAKAKAKDRTVEAKDTNFVLEDPRGQGLASRTTSLYKTKW